MSDTQIGIVLATIALAMIVTLRTRARDQAREAEHDRYVSLSPRERAVEDSARRRKRLLAEARPDQRDAILERFAFLDSIEHLSDAEQGAAYGIWQDGRSTQTGEQPVDRPMVVTARRDPGPRSIKATIFMRRTVEAVLECELTDVLRSLQDGNLSPADLVDEVIAAGTAVFSRYPKVSDGQGSIMTGADARAVTVAVLYGIVTEKRLAGAARVPLDPDTSQAIAMYEGSNRGDADLGSAALISIFQHIAAEAGVARLLSWQARPWGTPWAGRHEILAAADAVTEIGLRRGMCLGPCPVYTVTLRRDGYAEFVGESFVDRVGQHKAGLEAGAFDDLARAVMYLELGPAARPDSVDPVRHILDVSSTTVWVMRGNQRTDIAYYATLLGSLIDAGASELVWQQPEDPPSHASAPLFEPLDPGEQRT